MAVNACLNGGRTRAEHPAVPHSPAELAADARAVRAAGAFAVHIHPRARDGRQTLRAADCDAAVAAVRQAERRLPVGLSTAAFIEPDPFARVSAVTSWRQRPDFVSVNVSEPGWAGVVRAALAVGIAVEAGLATPADAQALSESPFTHRLLRALVEIDGGAEDAHAVAERIPPGISQLWHGYGERTWEVLRAALAAGHDVRVGLEDTLVLPDGRSPTDNAELVACAVSLAAELAL
jgi:uncharacterized protein (DUF849 family)